ncbi:hypothetical protein [Aurantibacter aestuarii]|uniref:hypothetical protein n=1 Tax=Aurantibacter aestuarii TaxID=1266046 RepID=UPI0015E668A9|nr:hypothetical protein [Aurantibacter aestuarii]
MRNDYYPFGLDHNYAISSPMSIVNGARLFSINSVLSGQESIISHAKSIFNSVNQ